MIISDVRAVDSFDRSAVWSALRQYKNERFVTLKLTSLHQPPDDQLQNARKQAKQIGYCISQAEEYFAAARSVGPATKPVLLYYGTLALSLAEILLKQSGLSSLDAARAQYAHHGLQFSPDGNPSRLEELSLSSAALTAKPLLRADGSRGGTFALWHSSSREVPMIGPFCRFNNAGQAARSIEAVCRAEDSPLEDIDPGGLSLLDCFRNLPSVFNLVHSYGIKSDLVRASASMDVNLTSLSSTMTVMVHPSYEEPLLKLNEHIKISEDTHGTLVRTEHQSGFSLRITNTPQQPGCTVKFPMSFQSSSKYLYFSPQRSLNEYGYYYVALFILSSYCRYFPDMWMADLERHSELVSVSTELLDASLTRVPSLALSELSRQYVVTGQLLS